MGSLVGHFIRNETGATALEYGLIAVGIGLVLVAALPTIGSKLESTFEVLSSNLDY
jgi:pilus assembly protein Flp/PilA